MLPTLNQVALYVALTIFAGMALAPFFEEVDDFIYGVFDFLASAALWVVKMLDRGLAAVGSWMRTLLYSLHAACGEARPLPWIGFLIAGVIGYDILAGVIFFGDSMLFALVSAAMFGGGVPPLFDHFETFTPFVWLTSLLVLSVVLADVYKVTSFSPLWHRLNSAHAAFMKRVLKVLIATGVAAVLMTAIFAYDRQYGLNLFSEPGGLSLWELGLRLALALIGVAAFGLAAATGIFGVVIVPGLLLGVVWLLLALLRIIPAGIAMLLTGLYRLVRAALALLAAIGRRVTNWLLGFGFMERFKFSKIPEPRPVRALGEASNALMSETSEGDAAGGRADEPNPPIDEEREIDESEPALEAAEVNGRASNSRSAVEFTIPPPQFPNGRVTTSADSVNDE